MKTLSLILLLASLSFGATYKGKSIDGKKYAASTRINGIIVPVTVRFEGRGVELWLDGKIVPMKLADEVIEDLNAAEVFDGKRDLILKVDLAD